MLARRVNGCGRVTRSFFGQGALGVLLFQGSMLIGTPTLNQITFPRGNIVPNSIISTHRFHRENGTTYPVPPQGLLYTNWWYKNYPVLEKDCLFSAGNFSYEREDVPCRIPETFISACEITRKQSIASGMRYM